MVMSWMELPKVIVLSINTVLILLYLIIIVALLYTTQKYKKIYSKYEISLNSLREYEKMMDKYRVANHENKNQLLTIRNMIKTSDQKSLKYVDKIIDNQNKDDQAIFCKTAKIPEGGLRATIYSEICKMNDLKINYSLDISNELKTADFINISDDTMINICKIMGVFLDNAIEEVQKLPKKRQNIIIEIFIQDNELIIDISNNYDNVIEIDKMSSKKYTTKGEGHGYGLSLVEDIVKNDNNIINEKFISKEKFTQRVIINI
jgi:two-component system sensor histidine kinase AgrC